MPPETLQFATRLSLPLVAGLLALGLEHSPLGDMNEHVIYLLKHERQLRDAFVHPTPRHEPGQSVRREQTYYEVELSTVSDLLDHTIALIRHVDGILNGRFGRVEIWLAERGADEKFASSTFH